MRREKLRDNFEGAIDSLNKLTQELCENQLSDNYRFVIRPNQESVHNHLTENEISFHKKILTLKNRPLEKNETVDLLWTENKVPLWINVSVIKSTNNLTIVELLTSRRLRGESDLNHKANHFPPFHLLVPLPPGHKDGEKFDINWTSQSKNRRGLWALIKELVNKNTAANKVHNPWLL